MNQKEEVSLTESDKVIQMGLGPYGFLVLTAQGKLFERISDPNWFNDGRTTQKFIWRRINGPLD